MHPKAWHHSGSDALELCLAHAELPQKSFVLPCIRKQGRTEGAMLGQAPAAIFESKSLQLALMPTSSALTLTFAEVWVRSRSQDVFLTAAL